jgi:hypothetical protein
LKKGGGEEEEEQCVKGRFLIQRSILPLVVMILVRAPDISSLLEKIEFWCHKKPKHFIFKNHFILKMIHTFCPHLFDLVITGARSNHCECLLGSSVVSKPKTSLPSASAMPIDYAFSALSKIVCNRSQFCYQIK